jgi:Nitroreductase family
MRRRSLPSPGGAAPTTATSRCRRSSASRWRLCCGGGGRSASSLPTPFPVGELAALLDWAATPVPADAPPVGTIGLIAHAVDGLARGIYRYDGGFRLLRGGDHRRLGGYLMLEQAHGARCAAAIFLLADLDAVFGELGGRGYRWAHLEAGIRAGRLQVGAFALGWGATASTFYDNDVSRAFETSESPMLAVAVGRR